MARLAKPLMTHGGASLTMSYYADKVVNHYNSMGPVKAALEAATRYVLAELGEKGIRVYAVSPGPLKTRAARVIAEFDELVAAAVAPQPRTSTGRYRRSWPRSGLGRRRRLLNDQRHDFTSTRPA